MLALNQLRLVCPLCAGPLALNGDSCLCEGCGRGFPTLLGIPDLRVPTDGFDAEADWRLAGRLASRFAVADSRMLAEDYWRARGETDPRRFQARVDYIFGAEAKFRRLLADGSLFGAARAGGGRTCLDLGCGPGGFALAAAERFELAVGADISMAWLVIAKKRQEEMRREALLLCANAERLPLASDQFDVVGLFDMIEHVADRPRTVQEVFRLARPGGKVICTTPNRYSLGGEPHVGVWGVGFLPRAWMDRYVRWLAGRAYAGVHLMSLFELRALFRQHSGFQCTVRAVPVWEGEVAAFGPRKAAIARLYNALVQLKLARAILLPVAPFFVVEGQKADPQPVGPDAP